MNQFSCYLVEKDAEGAIHGGLTRRGVDELSPGEVLIRVRYSSLNYKDALAATGHPGVARRLPHVPGIDAAGEIVESQSPDLAAGQSVLVTGYDLGAGRWGGWSELICVPAEWVIPLPAGLSLIDSMRLGTAGFTAALSIDTLRRHDVVPSGGEVLVTGATGGVGCLAVAILAKLGYSVAAASGKSDRRDWLADLGAARVIGRGDVDVRGGNPLLKALWAGAVDTVGGNTLATILRSTNVGGCVTACGLVGGTELETTVYPFLLRGIALCGIDTAWCGRERRLQIWKHLADDWKVDSLEGLSTTIGLSEVDAYVKQILAGAIAGRTVVRVDA